MFLYNSFYQKVEKKSQKPVKVFVNRKGAFTLVVHVYYCSEILEWMMEYYSNPTFENIPHENKDCRSVCICIYLELFISRNINMENIVL